MCTRTFKVDQKVTEYTQLQTLAGIGPTYKISQQRYLTRPKTDQIFKSLAKIYTFTPATGRESNPTYQTGTAVVSPGYSGRIVKLIIQFASPYAFMVCCLRTSIILVSLRHYATSRRVVGSIPEETIGFFN
jgi:hypothetical protein